MTDTDIFYTPVNYLTNGVNGTIWDGIYLGAGSIAGATSVGVSPGTVSIANAGISAPNTLTFASVQTDWENTADDGVFLFKMITGDFDMSVHVLGPIDSNAYNLPGLMVRAFGPGGSPAPNNAENFFLWARFDEFGIANMLKNNVNGGKTDTGEGIYPNTNYWLRITRRGNTFAMFEKPNAGAAWIEDTTLTRADFGGLPLEVGIEQADYAGGTTLPAAFQTFSLTVSNMGPFDPTPAPASGLSSVANANGTATLSWTPGENSSESVVAVWPGSAAVTQAPADGFAYTGNSAYGSGSALPGAGVFVVYSGSSNSVTVSKLSTGTTYNAAVFSCSGAGTAAAYNHSAPITAFTTSGNPNTGTAFTDGFTASVNYVTSGIDGTMWDGIYLGAGEFDNTGDPFDPSMTLEAQSGGGELQLTSEGTTWEGMGDTGFYLFKNVTGDFSCVAQIVTPFVNNAYNTAGIQVREAGPNGNPSSAGGENFLSLTRFDEYGFANYVRNEVNGVLSQINPYGSNTVNGNYWLRIDRVGGTTFNLFETDKATDPWIQIYSLSRPDWAGLPLQAGLIQATFVAGADTVNFANFSLHATNMGPFAAPPPSPSGMKLSTNAATELNASWTPAAGADGSLVVVWTTTNIDKEAPSDGFVYNANPGYGLGDSLPGASYFVVYNGNGSNVVITNIATGLNYNVAVFSCVGSGSGTVYNHTPALGHFAVPARQVSAQDMIHCNDVWINFTATPGKWYWLQYSDSLTAPNWINVLPGPHIGTNNSMTLVHQGGFGAQQRYYRVVQENPLFDVTLNNGAITSLKFDQDPFATEFLVGRLGDVSIKYSPTGNNWLAANTATMAGISSVTYSNSPDGTQESATCQITSGLAGGPLVVQTAFTFLQDTLYWSVNLTNLSSQPVVIGDLALPFPMNTTFSTPSNSVFKHSFISGNDSFIFWMRPNSIGPYLTMTPTNETSFEYWDDNGPGGVYEAYIHSAAAGAITAAEGTRWRQTNTSVTLAARGAAGNGQSYGVTYRWADNYDGVRQCMVDAGNIDVHVVPGMTVPTNLFAQIALRGNQPINAIAPEFPASTTLQLLGTNGAYQIYQILFANLGENKLTIQYGADRQMILEFFITEPDDTLIKKRAAFLAGTQITDPTKWYDGLYPDWNMNDQVLVTPDNYDTLPGGVTYEVASDDAGESRPAFMAGKDALYPVQSEVSGLDLYITNFVLGGLQRTTNETDSYGIYGIPDWHTLRAANNLSLGRGYDYPHIFAMYWGMYQVAKYHPEIQTALPASEYLQRAWGTAMALFNNNFAGGGQAYNTGLMNELVMIDIINELQATGQTTEAASLLALWQQKVDYFATGNANLFGSEYSFDSTGFESQEAFAKYAVRNPAQFDPANPSVFLQQAQQFMTTQITANMFDRGWLETAYYHYGSDFRGGGSDSYVLSYMSQMGGWGLLDYALYFGTNSPDFLRLGYASYLSAWATMNTGTAASNYGFWYPGAANDGDCGGGFEPSPYNTTWLGQPQPRGDWYYSAEENLGFCGALRGGASILADDPIFGRFCYGGLFTNAADGIEITPLDGVRRQFHAVLTNGVIHMVLQNDRFSSAQPIVLHSDLSQVSFSIESENTAAHNVGLLLTVPTTGSYTFSGANGVVNTLILQAGLQTNVALPMLSAPSPQLFVIAR